MYHHVRLHPVIYANRWSTRYEGRDHLGQREPLVRSLACGGCAAVGEGNRAGASQKPVLWLANKC